MIRLYSPEEDQIITMYARQALAKNEPVSRGLERAVEAIKEKCGIERTIKSALCRWSYLRQHQDLANCAELSTKSCQNSICANGPDYTSEEDSIIKERILQAVLREKKTITEGAKKAAEEIEARLGRKRTVSAVASRWHRWIKKHLPDSVKNEIDVVVRELSSMRLKKDLSAADIVSVAEKHNRNPLHVLGVCGNLRNGQISTLTTEQMLQLIDEINSLQKQVAALKNLNRALLAQLVSANRYRSKLLKSNFERYTEDQRSVRPDGGPFLM